MTDINTYNMQNPDFINKYADQRIAIGVAIFIGYFFHYVFFGSVYMSKNGKANELKEVEKNMFLYGIAGVLSCNLFQSGVYQAILAYLTMVFHVVYVVFWHYCGLL